MLLSFKCHANERGTSENHKEPLRPWNHEEPLVPFPTWKALRTSLGVLKIVVLANQFPFGFP